MRRRVAIRYGAALPPREAESKACRARLVRDRPVAQWFLLLLLFHQHQLTLVDAGLRIADLPAQMRFVALLISHFERRIEFAVRSP